MDFLGFMLGATAFNTAVQFRKPLRKAAVMAASQALLVTDRVKGTAYSLKEEIEDIIAEAQYENAKKNMPKIGEMDG